MKRYRPPTTVVLGSPGWIRSIARGCDHVHWSVTNGDPLDDQMGTLIDSSSEGKEATGKIVLLGRRADGHHHQLYGPITPEQYRALQTLKGMPAS